MNDIVEKSFAELKQYCEQNEFKGWDPYDGLNSKVLRISQLHRIRLIRLIWIQGFKRSPLNLRKLLLVPKDYNPQALGLFISGYCNLFALEQKKEYLDKIRTLSDELIKLETPGWSGSCWGYNFDWQARAFFQPKYAPTVVASTFIGYALLDAYEVLKDEKLLKKARSICDFILKDLNRTTDDQGNFAFSYSPTDHTAVFNASLLGSRMLSRVYHYTKEPELIEAAEKSVAFCCNYQKEDGSWTYGTKPYHQWIDNFHTGYNLECISEFQKYAGTQKYQVYIDKGVEFYVNHLFTEEGIAQYYSHQTYPIDINCPAQLIITLYRLNLSDKHRAKVDKVLQWTIENMQDSKGFFYYQLKKGVSSKIPYMRWAQAWMFNATTFYFLSKRSVIQPDLQN